jgi:hypothetical protein
MRGVVRSFKKDQGFGTVSAEGTDFPFDYEICSSFPDFPHPGDVVEVTTGLGRLGRPKATLMTFAARGGPPPADPPAEKAGQIAKDLEPYTRRGLFAGVDPKWIVEKGRGHGDLLLSVAHYFAREAPSAACRCNAAPSEGKECARRLLALVPELRAESVVPDGERLRLTLTPVGLNTVSSAVPLPVGPMWLVNLLLERLPAVKDRVFLLGSEKAPGLTFARLSPSHLRGVDPEKLLPLWQHQ